MNERLRLSLFVLFMGVGCLLPFAAARAQGVPCSTALPDCSKCVIQSGSNNMTVACVSPSVSCSHAIEGCRSCTVTKDESTILCAECGSAWRVNNGTCQACSAVTPNCTTCNQSGCTGCGAGFGLNQGTCQQCTSIDPSCTACGGGSCTGCAQGFGLNNGKCEACTSIDPNCSACANGACTACSAGFGLNNGVCQACSSITANCSGCQSGECTNCTNGFAANLAGVCVTPGTSSCVNDINGQCCRCPAGQEWTEITGCTGAPIGNTCNSSARQ